MHADHFIKYTTKDWNELGTIYKINIEMFLKKPICQRGKKLSKTILKLLFIKMMIFGSISTNYINIKLFDKHTTLVLNIL